MCYSGMSCPLDIKTTLSPEFHRYLSAKAILLHPNLKQKESFSIKHAN